jgi:hypothetical protein
MTDPIRAALRESARHLCSYAGGPSSLNSCCQGVNRCEEKAAEVIATFNQALAQAVLAAAKDQTNE